MTTATSKPWHALSAANTLARLEAAARLRKHGRNQLQEAPPVSPLTLLLDEFRSPLVLILIGAAVLLYVVAGVGDEPEQIIDASLILLIVVVNAVLGFVQNYRAQRGIEALKRLSAPTATVLRDGRHITVPATVLVPGDIVMLEEGARVPADCRLVEAYDLNADESALTGESLPVVKTLNPLAPDTNLAERSNRLYMGTTIVRGRGRCVVTDTGMATEMGTIAEHLQTTEERPTLFQQEVAELGKRITFIIGVLIALIALLHLTVGHFGLLETFVTAVALAVAAIPEGLPVVVTLALAFGTRRMLARKALVRSLPVVEMVGAAQVVCSDKTGTITEGRMSLRVLFWLGRRLEVTRSADTTEGEFLDQGRPTDQHDNLALVAAALCNNAHLDPDETFQGDPTEVALLAGAYRAGVDLGAYTRLNELPFSSERKMMSVVVERDGRLFVFAKGATEALLDRCTHILTPDGPALLTEPQKQRVLEENTHLAAQALRVLALAYKEGAGEASEEFERGLVFLGLAGLSDPPREEARRAIAAASGAGIRIVMITGDNRITAQAVGREVGLEGECLEGRDLDGLSQQALDDTVQRVDIFARAEPRHKLRILQSMQRRGRVVVMTGDGVNDAPALKGADAGIAMGVRGTDIARDASDMVLLDDNFATIVAAVEEGRGIYNNIKKFVYLLLTGNLAEVLVVLVGSFGGALPLTAVQILWVNLVTDSGAAVALGVDPPARGLMRQPPHRGTVLGPAMLVMVLAIGVTMGTIILATFFVGWALFDLRTAQTLTFTALVLQEYLPLVVIRYQERDGPFSNPWVVLAVAGSLVFQLVLIYTPLGQLFGVVALGLSEWGILLGGLMIGLATTFLLAKLIERRLGTIY